MLRGPGTSPRYRALGALLLGLAAALVGCGDTCEEASARIDECLGGDSNSYQGSEPECSGEIECAAECTIEARCQDIYDFFRYLPEPADNNYTACVTACEGEE
ncbi:hypothetical protein [Chondromyces apiculatus]|uniref:Lipoprotein n=1 Tax=Chondromyces apiculatus DSM 436 TaxID=1192034 RepID=A0A017TDN5_9BACT|nr:hypothetical protein [Chondromyces apiculatus]EYF07359.1 Hypothetical protein CAP_0112 [Chondromyces apiculatus DSM 436]